MVGLRYSSFPKGQPFSDRGGSGFISSNLVEALLRWIQSVLGQLFYRQKKENVAEFINNPNYTFVEGDIRDFKNPFASLYRY